jgi:hypothetical protein
VLRLSTGQTVTAHPPLLINQGRRNSLTLKQLRR